jgi:hypothetical protein
MVKGVKRAARISIKKAVFSVSIPRRSGKMKLRRVKALAAVRNAMGK